MRYSFNSDVIKTSKTCHVPMEKNTKQTPRYPIQFFNLASRCFVQMDVTTFYMCVYAWAQGKEFPFLYTGVYSAAYSVVYKGVIGDRQKNMKNVSCNFPRQINCNLITLQDSPEVQHCFQKYPWEQLCIGPQWRHHWHSPWWLQLLQQLVQATQVLCKGSRRERALHG